MKKVLLLIFVISTLISCLKDKASVNEFEGICDFKEEIFSPQGYMIKTIGEIDFNGSVKSFQFVNDLTGFALLSNNVGGNVEIFKTTDGGQNWINLNIGINKLPRSMIFQDENFGFITVHDVTGCPPPNCLNKCVILKTENGGLDWVQVEYEGLNGVLNHPMYDSNGNLYATLNLNSETMIMKSIDNALSWETHFSSADLFLFSFDIFEDKIYATAEGGRILVIDLDGQLIRTMETGNSSIWDFEILDENNLVVAMSGKVIKTSNAGATWEKIHDQSAKIIGFDSPEKGLMLMQNSSCPTDFYHVNDLIALSDNGGLNWKEAEKPTTNLRIKFKDSQKMRDGGWFIVISNTLMELSEN
ncbi:MAG: hypothetical protein IPI60_15625 [Saprospiraceae bacterium]|nr:hypothetical protein [Saprospiraceae bacterium]